MRGDPSKSCWRPRKTHFYEKSHVWRSTSSRCRFEPIFAPKMAPKTSLLGTRDGSKSDMLFCSLFGCVPSQPDSNRPAAGQSFFAMYWSRQGISTALSIYLSIDPVLVALIPSYWTFFGTVSGCLGSFRLFCCHPCVRSLCALFAIFASFAVSSLPSLSWPPLSGDNVIFPTSSSIPATLYVFLSTTPSC